MLPDPVTATDLNIYDPAPLPWDRVRVALTYLSRPETPQFLGTVGADGRPHSAGIGCMLHDEGVYFTSGPDARKTRRLESNPACTLSFRLPEIDLVLEGDAHRSTDPDEIDDVTALYRAAGWPAERAGDAVTAPFSAQSAGPAPWYLFRFTPRAAVGIALAPPHGATRWHFA